MKWVKSLLVLMAILLVIIQFIPVKLPSNSTDSRNDLISAEKLVGEVPTILRTSCYDCHSNQTHYPWYAHVAPVSWLVSSDVEEGRQKLNLSEWSQYNKRRKISKLGDIKEQVETGEMPMSIYTFIHRKTKLTAEQKKLIIIWSETMANKLLQ